MDRVLLLTALFVLLAISFIFFYFIYKTKGIKTRESLSENRGLWFIQSTYRNIGSFGENNIINPKRGESAYEFGNGLLCTGTQFLKDGYQHLLEDSSVYGVNKLYIYPLQREFGDVYCGKENTWDVLENDILRIGCQSYKYKFKSDDTLIIVRSIPYIKL
jgi:hypothetical protein